MYEAEGVRRLGSPPVMQTARIGGYSGMVGEALKMAGWDGLDSYRGYRAELEYPPAPSGVVMTCPPA